MTRLLASGLVAALAVASVLAGPTEAGQSKTFDPPLSAGKVRHYEHPYSTMLTAVREAVGRGPRELVSEEVVNGQTTVIQARNRPSFSSGRPAAQGQFRIVVEAKDARVDVRVFWPAAATFGGSGGGEELIFADIEARLK